MVQHLLQVYVQNNDTEKMSTLPVPLKTTAQELLEMIRIRSNLPAEEFVLYEAEFLIGNDGTIEDLKKGAKLTVNRHFIRPIHDQEYPVVILYLWRFNRKKKLMNFVVKRKTPEIQHDYVKFTLESLQRRVSLLEREEERSCAYVEERHEIMKTEVTRELLCRFF